MNMQVISAAHQFSRELSDIFHTAVVSPPDDHCSIFNVQTDRSSVHCLFLCCFNTLFLCILIVDAFVHKVKQVMF